MGKYIIKYEREGCIGAAVCAAVDPDRWVISNEDGKADLKNAIKNGGNFELEVDELSEQAIEAAKGCPVVVIKIFEKATGKQIV